MSTPNVARPMSSNTFRTVTVGNRVLTVQNHPVSEQYALENTREGGKYIGILALEPTFYHHALDSNNGPDVLSDELAAMLVDGLSPYDLAETIVGFDHQNNLVLVEVGMDVATAAADKAEDLAAE